MGCASSTHNHSSAVMSRVVFEIVLDPSSPEAVSEIEVEVHPDWAPIGAKRFMDLIEANYYNECRIYRVIPGFICQWGIPADPREWPKWGDNKIKDDPVKVSNTRGTLSYATSGPNCRGSQLFINYDDGCAQLDEQGFSPFAKVLRGMEVAEALIVNDDAKYGKIDQHQAKQLGNEYFKNFPLSYIKTAKVVA